jgi:hypothetical protein
VLRDFIEEELELSQKGKFQQRNKEFGIEGLQGWHENLEFRWECLAPTQFEGIQQLYQILCFELL